MNFTRSLLLVVLASFLGACSAEKPVYDKPKAIGRFSDRDSLILSVDAASVSNYNQEKFVSEFKSFRNPFVDFKEPEVVKPEPDKPQTIVKPVTIDDIFKEAIDLLGPKSILVGPKDRFVTTDDGPKRVGFVIEWSASTGEEYKVTLVEITSNSYSLEYKGTKQRFPIRK